MTFAFLFQMFAFTFCAAAFYAMGRQDEEKLGWVILQNRVRESFSKGHDLGYGAGFEVCMKKFGMIRDNKGRFIKKELL